MRWASICGALSAWVLFSACGDATPVPGNSTTSAADAATAKADAVVGNADALTQASDAEAVVDTSETSSQDAVLVVADAALPAGCTGTADGTPCDDGDPCTQGSYCASGTCTGGLQLCACKTNGDCIKPGSDACAGQPYCDLAVFPYQCTLATGPVNCPPTSNPCTKSGCNPANGACETLQAPDGTACPSLDPCAVNPVCQGGSCKALASWCQCSKDSDCAGLNDANACLGKHYCEKSQFPWLCKVNPVTVVVCPPSADPCKLNACNPKTAMCATASAADGTLCDDGKTATVGDTCQKGACISGTDTALCGADTDCKDDGDLCNGVLFCNKANKACELNPATVVSCPTASDTACIKNKCQKSSGLCAPTAVTPGTPCDDGDGCTTGDICVAGACKPGTNTCPCKSDAECAGKDDGNVCNGTLFCNFQSGACQWNPASVVTCPSVKDTACTKAKCLPETGKCAPAPVADNSPCDDGSKCTDGDSCKAGQCAPGTFICACKEDADCMAEEDGNLCNGTLYCDKGALPAKCKVNPGTVVGCSASGDTACLKAACNPATGKCGPTPVADFAACEDGLPCTKNDACLFGKCQPGDYVCECNSAADCLKKDDGDLCNGVWYCDKTGVAPVCAENAASAVFCPKTNDGDCSKNACDPKTGQCLLKPATDGTACSDGSKCTQAAACKSGACKSTASVNCDDGDVCTADSCDPAAGCVHKGANCADGNPCSVDSCDPKTGQCAFATAPLEGKACNADDDGCTAGDLCNKGVCKKGVAVICKVAVAACEQVACSSTGAQSFACVVSAAGDGAPCESSDGCLLGAACLSGVCAPGKQEKLFAVTHPGPVGHLELRAVAVHPDGGYVAAGRRPLPLSGQVTATAWHVERMDAAGGVQWQAALPAGTAEASVGVAGVDVQGDGQIVVAGTVRPVAGEGLQARVSRLGTDGKSTVWQQEFGQLGAVDEIAADLTAHPAGGWLVAGGRTVAATADAWVVRVADSGKQLWQWQSSQAGADALRAVIALPGGGALAVGYADPKPGTRNGLAVRLDAQGTPVWSVQPGSDPWQELTGVAAAGDGALLAGVRMQAGVSQWWLVQVDQAGAVQWQQTGTGSRDVRGIVGLGGGVWVLAGAALQDPKNPLAWLAGVAGDGHVLWEANYDSGGPGTLHAVRAAADGGVLAAGTASVGGAAVGVVVHADAWGRAGCKAAGLCAAKSAADCDDGKPCTDDWCEPKKGCAPIGNSQPCSDGDTCTAGDLCKLGACAPGKPLDCNDKEACTADSCDKVKGCQHQTLQGPCDDGNPCTESESCQAGVCKGKDQACDDGNACTSNACEPAKGCVFALDSQACEDGNGCTDDNCDKVTGCKHVNNLAPCDANNPCTVGDACAAGACKAGSASKFFGVAEVGTNEKTGISVHHLALRAAGGVFATIVSTGNDKVGVSALSPLGAPVWFTAVVGNRHSTGLYDLASTADGGAVAVGWTTAAGAGAEDGLVVRFDPTGKKLWEYTYGGAQNDWLGGVAVLADGGLIAVGTTYNNGAANQDGWWLHLSKDGVVAKQKQFGGAGYDYLWRVAVNADGETVAVGRNASRGAGGSDGWMVRADAAGVAQWQRTYGTTYQDLLNAVALLPDGDIVAGGLRSNPGAPSEDWLLRTNPMGVARWQRQVVTQGKDVSGGVVRIAPHPDGSLAVAHAGVAAVTRLDGDGRNLAATPLPYGGHDVVGTADGGMWLARTAIWPEPLVLRLSPWGYATCTDAGKCASPTWQSCQDKNPCTTGTCAPATGCVQVANKDPCEAGAPCTAADTCAGGSCQPGNPRLFDGTASGTGQDEEFLGVLVARDGDTVVSGGTSQGAWLRKLNPAGALRWELSLPATSVAWCRSAVEMADGRLALACTNSFGGRAVLQVVDRLGAAVHTVQLFGPASTPNAEAWGIATVGDDDLVIVGNQPEAGAFVMRTSDSGKPVWSKFLGQKGDAATGLARSTDEQLLVGLRQGGTMSLAAFGLDGTKTWQTALAGAAPGWLGAVAALPDGGAVVGGYVGSSTKGAAFVTRVNQAGKVVWTWNGPNSFYFASAYAATATPQGVAVAGFTQTNSDAKSMDGWLASLDLDGHLIWERTFGGANRDVLYGLAAVPGGGLFAAGHTQSKGAGGYDAWMVRADAWGQAPCAVSGACAKADFNACDDKDACTLDVCLPLGGCKHDPVQCGGGKVCKAGACEGV